MSASSSTTRMCGALRGPVPAPSEPRIRESLLIGKPPSDRHRRTGVRPGQLAKHGQRSELRRVKSFQTIWSCPLSPQLFSTVARAGRRPRAVDQGQQHRDTRPPFGAVVGIDPAAVLLHDLLDDREAEPRALRLARDVRVEDAAQELALEAGHIVTHGHRGVLALVLALRGGLEPGRDLEPRLRRSLERLERVGDEVVEDLPHPAAVRLDGFEPLVEAQVNGCARVLRAVELRDLGDELIQAEAADPYLRRARVLTEGIYHLLHGLDLLHDG